jgi:hypothetical protein
VPLPDRLTVSAKAWAVAKVAVTVIGALPLTVHGPVPLQPPPLQPVNVDPQAGVAVSVTVVPLGYVSVQSVPQTMPIGLLLTTPMPVPAGATVRVKVVAVIVLQSSFE